MINRVYVLKAGLVITFRPVKWKRDNNIDIHKNKC